MRMIPIKLYSIIRFSKYDVKILLLNFAILLRNFASASAHYVSGIHKYGFKERRMYIKK